MVSRSMYCTVQYCTEQRCPYFVFCTMLIKERRLTFFFLWLSIWLFLDDASHVCMCRSGSLRVFLRVSMAPTHDLVADGEKITSYCTYVQCTDRVSGQFIARALSRFTTYRRLWEALCHCTSNCTEGLTMYCVCTVQCKVSLQVTRA